MSTTQNLKAVATGQVQRAPRTIIDLLDDPRVKSGLSAVAGRFLQPDRLLKLCVNTIRRTPNLLKCDPQTVLGAMMATTALGLEPNTPQQLAFLIPYSNRRKVGNEWKSVYECQFQIGARGFTALAYRSPHVRSLQAESIHRGDRFRSTVGTNGLFEYEKALVDRGELIGAFSYVRLQGDAEVACVLPLEEIHKIRARSEAWRRAMEDVRSAENDKDRMKAEAKLAETPWVMWEDDMAAKSAIKKHGKQLPIASSDLLIAASGIDDAGEVGRLNLKALSDPEVVKAVIGGEEEPPAVEYSPGEILEQAVDSDRVVVPVSEAGAAAAANKEDAADAGMPAPLPPIDPADRPDTGTDARDAQQPQRGGQREAPARDKKEPKPGDQQAPTPASYAKLAERINRSDARDVAELILDEGRHLPADQQRELGRLVDDRFPPI